MDDTLKIDKQQTPAAGRPRTPLSRAGRLAGFLAALGLFFIGCAVSGKPAAPAGTNDRPSYEVFFARLDSAVDASGAGHAAWAKIPGHPTLRTDRFLAALKNRLGSRERQRWWIAQLQALDLQARSIEIDNLLPEQLDAMAGETGAPPDPEALKRRMREYSDRWLASLGAQPDFFESLTPSVTVPQEYSTAMRVAGLYPLAALPVAYLTHRAQKKFRTWHATPAKNLPVLGTLTAFTPGRAGILAIDDLETFFADRPRDPLGLPVLTRQDRIRLAAALAPVIIQDTAADYDRIGPVQWAKAGIQVGEFPPTVYYYLTRAFFKGDPVIQVNYSFWYPGRMGPAPPVIEKGPLDGLTVRVTLEPDGLPVVVDIMNSCGCYHFFLPRQDLVAGPAPAPWAVDPFVPRWMPAGYPAQELLLRVNSGWHQVERVETGAPPADARVYLLAAYENLESLPRGNGRRESLFTPKGIAKNSERIEPYILFSMGIPQVGSMRQRGHHALSLVGRSYFDDPALFDRSLIYK